jgi:hypothetical protein
MRDLLLRGGRLWGRDGPAADILVKGGLINRIAPGLKAGRAVARTGAVLR